MTKSSSGAEQIARVRPSRLNMLSENGVLHKLANWALKSKPTHIEIAHEWDMNVPLRAMELEQSVDATFREVIVPGILRLLANHRSGKEVLDVGCGLGYLSAIVAENGYHVTAIDISCDSIAYGKKHFPQVNFQSAEITEFTRSHKGSYDTCVANMVLHNTSDLDLVLRSIYESLREGGLFIFTIPHPLLWSFKRPIDFWVRENYREEQVFKVPFRIRNGQTHPSAITYFHRPVEKYLMDMLEVGFTPEKFDVLPCVGPADLSVMVGRK